MISWGYDPLIVLQNHDSLQLGHFSYWGFGGREADFLSECGSFVILSGKVWGVGWGLSTAASLSQVGRGWTSQVGSQWGQRFPHLVPSKNIELVVSLGQKSPEQGGCPQWGPLTVSLWSCMSFFSGQLLKPCLLTLAERPQL